ncbi:DUF5403 family protein [Mycolicibacterium aichiense]|uniref:Head-to-tail connector protein n=1 Tax=Mycolicibacterium aichiense TaxID=1799 RepID=A0AAD1ME18_9MYCO|nr:hypothetical protein [Mycolicibacterium aichiense]MCV7016722.1 hypothetical protein [Mycolicibacterium aichiense]QFG07988.1 hypothetical protein SEA_HERBERTWM_18 [Mycobacterium phage Herbertwm]BBX09496.1 hypothetical protein MAIC_42990 [Mycolicibacterium aichiense]SUA14061.1 Uncharacterised protein [Mycolicibacterium aichiense]
MAKVYAIANEAAARHVDTKRGVRRVNRDVSGRARSFLAQANKTTRVTPKGYFPAEIESTEHDVDCFTTLHAPNAMALEFGHDPSGWFAGTDTKPPDPEYILTRAAYGGHTM